MATVVLVFIHCNCETGIHSSSSNVAAVWACPSESLWNNLSRQSTSVSLCSPCQDSRAGKVMILHHTALHCIIPHCTASYRTALHCRHMRATIIITSCHCRHMRATIIITSCYCRHMRATIIITCCHCRHMRATIIITSCHCRHIPAAEVIIMHHMQAYQGRQGLCTATPSER